MATLSDTSLSLDLSNSHLNCSDCSDSPILMRRADFGLTKRVESIEKIAECYKVVHPFVSGELVKKMNFMLCMLYAMSPSTSLMVCFLLLFLLL